MVEDIRYILGEIENYNRDNAYLLDIEELFEAIEHLIKAYKELKYKYNKALSDLVQAEHKNKELEEYKRIAELTKISCCTAQNCEALNNSIKDSLENMELKERITELEEEKQQVLDDYQDLGKDLANNYIPFSLVEEKIEELKQEYELLLEHQSGRESKATIKLQHKIEMCEELLEKR